jgi:hypothetical protein
MAASNAQSAISTARPTNGSGRIGFMSLNEGSAHGHLFLNRRQEGTGISAAAPNVAPISAERGRRRNVAERTRST